MNSVTVGHIELSDVGTYVYIEMSPYNTWQRPLLTVEQLIELRDDLNQRIERIENE